MISYAIEFCESSNVYYEGDPVEVAVLLELKEPASVTNVKARFLGLSGLKCCKTNEIKSLNIKTDQSGLGEIYFDEYFPIFSETSSEPEPWPVGAKTWKLSFQLPKKLASSFEGVNGYVRYSFHLYADVNNVSEEVKKYFTVVSKVNLKKIKSANEPIVMWKSDNHCVFSPFLCNTNQIRFYFFSSKQGYVPGETIVLNGEMSNFHRHPIEWVKACLIQVVKYKGGKEFKEKRIVSEVIRGCILPMMTQNWTSEHINVPAIPPSTSKSNTFVTIKYRLSLQYKPYWQRNPVSVEEKVIIGAHMTEVDDYKECAFGPHLVGDEDFSCRFSPMYPVCSNNYI